MTLMVRYYLRWHWPLKTLPPPDCLDGTRRRRSGCCYPWLDVGAVVIIVFIPGHSTWLPTFF